MTNLSDYLASFDHISAVTPMTIEIKGETFEACSYVARFETPEGSEAYRRGERTYWRAFIYCIGELPSCYRRNTHVAFTIPGDLAEWYVACYWPQLYKHKQEHKQDLSVTPGEYQPFGANFMLAPWDDKDPIDYYERKPYRRVRVTIQQS